MWSRPVPVRRGLARSREGAGELPGLAQWLSTHPDHQSRIDAIEAQAHALGPVTARPLGVDLDAVQASLGTDGPGDGPR